MSNLTIQELHKYYKLIKIGILDPIKCPNDETHTSMIPNYDFDNDSAYFWCLACNAKLKFGHNSEESIRRRLDMFENL